MPKIGITRFWTQKSQEILKTSNISVAKKILAYKIFLRPMLIYDWFEKQSQTKALEVKALRQIFGPCSEKKLYSKYSDTDVLSYMKIEEIRWRRKTGSPNNLRRMLHTMSRDVDDHIKYFSKANFYIRDRKATENNRKTTSNDSEAGPSNTLRRSRRLASKAKDNEPQEKALPKKQNKRK